MARKSRMAMANSTLEIPDVPLRSTNRPAPPPQMNGGSNTIKSVAPNSTGFGINMSGKGKLRVVPNTPTTTKTLIHNQLDESPPNMRVVWN